jgi:hypothetical protein
VVLESIVVAALAGMLVQPAPGVTAPGAPGALVVGGVDQPDIPAVPVWTFPAP